MQYGFIVFIEIINRLIVFAMLAFCMCITFVILLSQLAGSYTYLIYELDANLLVDYIIFIYSSCLQTFKVIKD